MRWLTVFFTALLRLQLFQLFQLFQLVAHAERLGVTPDLRVTFQWKQIEYEWPSNETRSWFPHYKQEDNLPLGLEVTSRKIFVTVPRWKPGVASSLNYIRRNDTRESPELIPYPSWSTHRYGPDGAPPGLISTFRIKADRCDRLWVLDTGLTDILGTPEQQAPPALLIFDLKTDRLMRKYVVPAEQRTPDSLFANIAVEDFDCDDTYGYLGDLGGPGLVVYSWAKNRSWLVKHSSFEPDPKGGEFNVSGIWFQWTDGLFGMALAPKGNGYSTLYFHALSSSMEFSVETEDLRDEAHVHELEKSKKFQALGSRGTNGQSSVSFFDPKTRVLFYALTNQNAIACWRPSGMFKKEEQGLVLADNVTMVFPNDLKVDPDGNLWVLSDRLPTFMYSHLDPEDYNFRILSGPTDAVINGTVCEDRSGGESMKNETTQFPTEHGDESEHGQESQQGREPQREYEPPHGHESDNDQQPQHGQEPKQESEDDSKDSAGISSLQTFVLAACLFSTFAFRSVT